MKFTPFYIALHPHRMSTYIEILKEEIADKERQIASSVDREAQMRNMLTDAKTDRDGYRKMFVKLACALGVAPSGPPHEVYARAESEIFELWQFRNKFRSKGRTPWNKGKRYEQGKKAKVIS